MTDLAPITLADRIPTITEVIAQRIAGICRIDITDEHTEMYRLGTEVQTGEDGKPFIVLDVAEFGPEPQYVRVYIHISDPVTRRVTNGDGRA